MILWSIQSTRACRTLETSGKLRCDVRLVEKDFVAAYRWMAEQMDKRLRVRRSTEDASPVWAWYQWDGGGRRRRPDLRSSGHLPRGERGVRIEFAIDDEMVVLSDFQLWHYVLNYWYLPASTDEGEAFEARVAEQGLSFYRTKPLPDPALDEAIRRSWERIFDLEWAEEDLASPRAEKSIQAALWELPLETVRRVDEFVAR